MSVAMKPFSILFGMTLVVMNGTVMAADAAAIRVAPVPVFAYPPLYSYPVYTLPYYMQLAQNPYLPPRPPVAQTPPPNMVYPWPFFMMVPQPSTPAAVAPSPAPVASPQAPQLTQEAQKALAQAQADVQSARATFTLWVPAENAFNTAQEAAKVGDSAAVLKQAKAIAELTRLGAAQANYLSTDALEVPAVPVVVPAAQVGTPPPVAADAKVATTPELTGEARVALAQAEIDVQTARDNFILWVPAENAFNTAQEAAKAGDSVAVLKQAKTVSALIKLGAEQANYPSTEALAAPVVIAAVQEVALPPPLAAAVVAAAAPPLTDEARKALAQAEADVQAARAAFTLWVPAENALSAAQEAAKAGDGAAVLKQAKLIAELTQLGTAQAKYPSTEVAAKPAAKRKAKAKPKSTVKKASAKPRATSPTSKPKAASSSAKAAAPTTAKPAAPASVSTKPAAVSAKPAATDNKIKPRKLCWQGDRLEECP